MQCGYCNKEISLINAFAVDGKISCKDCHISISDKSGSYLDDNLISEYKSTLARFSIGSLIFAGIIAMISSILFYNSLAGNIEYNLLKATNFGIIGYFLHLGFKKRITNDLWSSDEIAIGFIFGGLISFISFVIATLLIKLIFG